MIRLVFRAEFDLGEAQSPVIPRAGDVVHFFNTEGVEVHHKVQNVLYRFNSSQELDHVVLLINL